MLIRLLVVVEYFNSKQNLSAFDVDVKHSHRAMSKVLELAIFLTLYEFRDV